MKYYVGLTDAGWFRFLSQRGFDEVNFWRPKDQRTPQSLSVGEPFAFKLKKPVDMIVGIATFVDFKLVPVHAAWQAFGEENGAPDYPTFIQSLGNLAKLDERNLFDRMIGCIILGQPVFFEEKDWIPAPQNWPRSAVQGAAYDTRDEIGAALWAEIESRRSAVQVPQVAEQRSLYGEPRLVRPRLGQGAFRLQTLDNYNHTCCITGETTEPVIEAAHILPVSKGGQHQLDNGLALRADMHILFDQGLISIDPDFKIHVSERIRHLYHNGVAYYRHELEPLRALPAREKDRPSREFLEWHYREAFIA